MPLVERIRIQEGVIYGIWEIEEPAPYFEERLMLSPDEANQVMALKGRRQIEWLASRWLLHMISAREKRSDLVKDSYGKPHILGQGDFISISHTHGFTAAILADKPVGIDVQVRVEKIYRIANKFMNQEEITNVNPLRQLDFLHVYWGAKECLYKAHGRRQLDFRKHLFISPFSLEQGCTTGQIKKDDTELTFDIYFQCTNNYILVYSIQR